MHGKIPNLASTKAFSTAHPEFPENTVRDWIYHAEERITARGEPIPPNGFASCIVRVGRLVFIDLDALAVWLERGRAAPLAELERDRAAA